MSEALPSLWLVLNEAPGLRPTSTEPIHPVTPPGLIRRPTWRELRDQVLTQAPLLSAPAPGVPGLCAVCRGPASRGSVCCFQCDLHRQCAPGSLADIVVPVAFAIKGGPHASNLWRYKSGHIAAGTTAPTTAETTAQMAARPLLALLLVFLRDHGACVWRAAGRPAPTHLAVVPTARGRPGAHPLRSLISPYLTCRWAELSARPGDHPVRELDPGRFSAAPIAGASVLLLDDTWTTGSTAQSATMALRRSGATSIAIVVLGRHVSVPASGASLPGIRDVGPQALPFRPEFCAVHDDGGDSGRADRHTHPNSAVDAQFDDHGP